MIKSGLWIFRIILGLPLLVLLGYSMFDNWIYPNILPTEFTLAHIIKVFSRDNIGLLLSSISLSMFIAIISTLIALPAGRAFGLYEFKGKSFLKILTLTPILIPSMAYFIGLQGLFSKMRIIDTHLAVIISHLIVILPYSIWLLSDIIQHIGDKFEEQARTLGADKIQVFKNISLPIILPALSLCTAQGFIISFSQYFLTLIMGGGQIRTFAMVVVPYIQSGNRALSSSYSLVFILISIGVYGLFSSLTNRFYKKYFNLDGGGI